MGVERHTALLPGVTKVVELGETVATAVCGRYLERMGATVTRVLPVGVPSELVDLGSQIGVGANQRSAIAEWLHDGKTLMEVDLASPADHARLDQILRGADVVVIGGTTAEWETRGLTLEHVRATAPNAVIGQITPWGDSGPYAQLRGGEFLAQAAGGLMNLVGRADREPVRIGGFPMQAAAGLLAMDGVVIGLFHRQNTGQGSQFETSEFESVAHVEWKIASAVQSGLPRERRGDEGGGPVVARTRDGHFGCFFIPNNWTNVKAVLGDVRLEEERFSTPSLRAANAEEYAGIVEEATHLQSKKELYYKAQERGIPAGYVATMSDLLESPQNQSRNFFQPIHVDGIGSGVIPDAPWQVLTIADLEEQGAPA